MVWFKENVVRHNVNNIWGNYIAIIADNFLVSIKIITHH